MSSSKDLVFITGATGFIGATTALQTLQAGYRVRLCVRKESAITKLKHIYAQHLDKIEFDITPDFTAPDAFSNSLDDVTHILHIASPLPSSLVPDEVIKPAVDGTLNILKAAAKVQSVRKIVTTSSFVALAPFGGAEIFPEGVVVTEDIDLGVSVSSDEKFENGNPMFKAYHIYAASKKLANKASSDFLATQKPSFDLVTIYPTCVYGTDLVQDSLETIGANKYLFGSIVKGSQGFDMALAAAHVGDVAQAHVRALADNIKTRSFLINGKRFTWKDVREWTEKYYPEEAKGFKLEPNAHPKLTQIDTSRAEKELGIEWVDPEIIVKEVLDQQLGFLRAAKS